MNCARMPQRVGEYGIEAAAMKRVAAQQPAESHPSATDDAVFAHGNGRIFGAGGLKATCAGESCDGVQERRQRVFVDTVQSRDDAVAQAHSRSPSFFSI